MRIAPAAGQADLARIAPLRAALWPDSDMAELTGREADPDHRLLIASDAAGNAVGFAELALRHDYVNGCDDSPVAFLEGIYVAPAHRRAGIARALVAAAWDWAQAQGIAELASDALLDNVASHAFHRAVGFAETERVVCFRMTGPERTP